MWSLVVRMVYIPLTLYVTILVRRLHNGTSAVSFSYSIINSDTFCIYLAKTLSQMYQYCPPSLLHSKHCKWIQEEVPWVCDHIFWVEGCRSFSFYDSFSYFISGLNRRRFLSFKKEFGGFCYFFDHFYSKPM